MSTNEMHTVNEYVVIPDLVNTARFCRQVVTYGY
jgi:acetylornithine deacetylase/succinyl-diaminopimelate desuccinylase-like protein